ncbi:hypothetical protein H1Z61_14955 [Bacillus aquiflavi]|uniref:Uncharacterized protein n=1 Tax=Bacillus aquiflavi TaxID=2672567 RepID=A0A6B3W4M0_9BACI|nr:hypothetical protein [Bacillus aquiflavi]MBA4538396.1 hypothetical protein [Bacillus aquiflavi]NEY82761.1 hypothetical protein [Bacillus aquiflavi]UAC48531.1 hypothetical protein K6959_00545 [Bacillus aquiflavi]
MKKIVLLFVVICLLVVGCSSEKKIANYVKENINERYGIEAEIIDMKPQEVYGSIFVIIISGVVGFFGGESYDLVLETTDEPVITFDAYCSEGEIHSYSDNYIDKKYEWLVENDKDYAKQVEALAQHGIKDIEVTGGNEDILFKASYENSDLQAKEMLGLFRDMGSKILENVPFEVSLAFDVETKDYSNSELGTKQINLEIYSNQLDNAKEMVEVLADELAVIQSNEAMSDEIVKKLEGLNFDVSSSLNETYGRNEVDLTMYQHSIWLRSKENLNWEHLVKALNIMRDAGMSEAYVELISEFGFTDACLLKELEDEDDIKSCFMK